MSSPTKREDKQAGLFANGQAVPLLGVDVRAEVVAGHARAVVRQRYRNDETRPIEAIYTFPLPTRGAVTGFAMSVNGRHLVGEVHEREEAFKRYDDAVSAGHGGALLEQERPNVFTANVGNLLPGEETIIEIEYVEPVTGDEGAIRWSMPTLVAPRYMPGTPGGPRTAHGSADPTSLVPDADRISPPIGDAPYGLSLELVLDLGCDVEVESPSHDIRVQKSGAAGHERTRVSFAQRAVALDRDVVITAFPVESASSAAPLTSVVAHRVAGAGNVGTFAVTLVPDLAGGLAKRDLRSDVVFVIDRSGSMGGASMDEAKRALRLCLRQLREGDRFAIIAFDDQVEKMARAMTALTPATLRAADAWIEGIDARGGTEMMEPLIQAIGLAPSGVVVLLTDGQVGNEEAIQREALEKRSTARVYSFGIGTNVSDALLVGLAEKTGGAVEMIHPGERIEDKVVAQFARAMAPRVTDVKITFRGVDVGEIAPAEATSLVDGEPFTIFGTYEAAGIGAVEIRGTYEGERLYLEVPLDLPEVDDRPSVTKLWAQARIRDLEHAALVGRRADSMKDRIVKLAVTHGVSSKYTSFVVVEKRTGDRRVNEQAETRVVPVSAPAGWSMANARHASRSRSRSYGGPPAAGAGIGGFAVARRAMTSSLPASGMAARPGMVRPSAAAHMPSPPPPAAAPAPSARASRDYDATRVTSLRSPSPPASMSFDDDADTGAFGAPPVAKKGAASSDPATALFERQGSAGLWEEAGRDAIEVSVEALLSLVRLGISASHPVHGAQTKKAVDALLEALQSADPKLVELALATLWLVSTGRRTRVAIREAAAARPGLEALAAVLGRDEDVRAHVERIAPMC